MRARFIGSLLVAVLGSTVATAAEPLRFAVSSAWAMPYGRFESERFTGGLVYDIGAALEKSLGIPFNYVVLPRKRVDAAVLSGEVDLRCFTNPQWTAIPDQHVWSKSLFDITEVIFGGFDVAEPRQLQSLVKGASISTVLGYEYKELEPLFASGALKRDDAIDQEKVMLKLTAGRTPYGVSESLALQWYVRNTPRHQFAPWRLVLSRNDFQCGVPKKGRIPAARILGALEELKRNGKIDEILRNYR